MLMTYKKLSEHVNSLTMQRDELILKLRSSREQAEYLDRSKFKVSQIIKMTKDGREILQINNIFSSPSGLIVEVL